MRILILCIALSPVSGLAAENVLCVATFNINWADTDLAAVEQVIREANADVVCLQETTPRSENFLRSRFAGTYSHAAFRGYRGKYRAERAGFLSKTKLRDLAFTPPAGGLFGTHFATIDDSDREVRIVNVHLSPFTIRRGSGFRQALRDIASVEGAHQKESQAIEAKTDWPDVPTIVCGDFNSLSTFVAPQRLKDRGFVDSFASINEDAHKTPTWRWPVGAAHIQFRIDYIFHSTRTIFTRRTSRILPTLGSDHALVVSEFVWKSSDK